MRGERGDGGRQGGLWKEIVYYMCEVTEEMDRVWYGGGRGRLGFCLRSVIVDAGRDVLCCPVLCCA